MYKTLSLLFLFISSYYQLGAQVFPREGSKLCYRIIGFSFPVQVGANKYKIEIAKGAYDTESDFEKNVTASVFTKKNKTIAEVSSFGQQYTWRIICYTSTNSTTKSILHHFSVNITPDVDTSATRLRVTKDMGKYKDAYVFIDGNKALYDMKGNPVWYMRGTEQASNQNIVVRDLKPTPQGSITFFTGGHPYEINYNGDVLWQYKGSSANDYKIFHHEFTRLKNGHYMGMIYEDQYGHPQPLIKDSAERYVYDSAGFFRTRFGSSLAEFDQDGHCIWHWSGLAYENSFDMGSRKTIDCSVTDFDFHENSFFFDEDNKVVYLSFRNICRIIKIKYPEGNVLNTYGTIYKPGMKDMENGLFCGQHSCTHTPDGYLCLFNNNVCNDQLPSVLLLKEPAAGKNDLKKVWEYQCTVENKDSTAIRGTHFLSGGSVVALAGQAMLVMMGMPYPEVFIVNRDKKILWSAIPEKYHPTLEKWVVFEQYRASIINRKDLEQLIWNSEK